ncbi:unnamed protein product [Lupinus luteus]|uniref:Uncharacterized protein n=1 Tax=Lupinus luteus TaxID=3873 RepID=A0AAV1XFQ5_LUPLU
MIKVVVVMIMVVGRISYVGMVRERNQWVLRRFWIRAKLSGTAHSVGSVVAMILLVMVMERAIAALSKAVMLRGRMDSEVTKLTNRGCGGGGSYDGRGGSCSSLAIRISRQDNWDSEPDFDVSRNRNPSLTDLDVHNNSGNSVANGEIEQNVQRKTCYRFGGGCDGNGGRKDKLCGMVRESMRWVVRRLWTRAKLSETIHSIGAVVAMILLVMVRERELVALSKVVMVRGRVDGKVTKLTNRGSGGGGCVDGRGGICTP